VRARRAAALTVLATALVLSCVKSVTLPGHRGAARVAEDFRPGRWDARFLVARGPAAIVLPALSGTVTLTLSGPARVTARYDGHAVVRDLAAEPEPWSLDLATGGRVALEADSTIRLHAVTFARASRTPSAPMLGLVLAAAWDRGRVPFAALALLASMAVAAGAARGLRARTTTPAVVPLAAASVVLISCLAQVTLVPQPLLIGDPAAYFDMAGHVRDALRTPLALGESLYDLRPYAGLAATSTLYGILRLVRDDPRTIYAAQAFAMAGAVFFLVRAAFRYRGRRLAVLVGILTATYAPFAIICGLVQPEPFILLLWCFAFDRLLAVARDDDEPARRLVPAGLAFGLGLALHPQGIWYLLAAAALCLTALLPALRRPRVRHRVLAFVLGLLPVMLATAAGESYARPAARVLEERYGFFAYTAPHPLGFWVFLETDGWQGPVRLDETRYALDFAEARDAGAITSGADAWRFTLRFIARNGRASVRAVLRNLHRLFERPDNDFHRTWILPYSAQLRLHRALIAAFLLAAALLAGGAAAVGLVPVAILAATYPLYHIFNKYAVPGMPFILFGAGVFLEHLLARGRRARPYVLLLGGAALATWVTPADLALRGVPADLARWMLLGLLFTAVGAAQAWTARGTGRAGRLLAGLVGAAWVGAIGASQWDDPSWRAFTVSASETPRQEIALDRHGLDLVRGVRESYLALDLTLGDGDPADLRLTFDSGLVVSGADLVPTMPAFGLATFRGGRDPRQFPQWWITPWRDDMQAGGRLAVTISGARDSRLGGDIGADTDGVHQGLSLGHWPLVSVYRLMHEGEYRLPVRQPVEPSGRRSFRHGQSFVGTYGVRIVALDDDAGGARWETAEAPSGTIVTAVWARAGRPAPEAPRPTAELHTPAGRLTFELGGKGPWKGDVGEWRYVPTAEYEGWFVLRSEIKAPGPLQIDVRPWQRMSWTQKYFLPEIQEGPPPLPPEWAGLPYVPPLRILDGRPAPAWRPVGVY
jgi:hypothetical protein